MFERDLVIGNATVFKYWSPKAYDVEGNLVSILFKDHERREFRKYLEVGSLRNESFYLSIDTS